MHISTLVDDVEKVVETLRTQYGDYTFAMLYNRVLGSGDGWNFIVSAPWTDKMQVYDAIRLIAEALHDGLDAEAQKAITRITVLKTSDPFVRDMNFLYRAGTPGAGLPVNQIAAGDIEGGGGYIFYSQKSDQS